MLNKKIIFGLISILLVGTLFAQVVGISLTDVIYSVKEIPVEESNSQIVTYDCGRETRTVELTEPDGKIDENDLLTAMNDCKEEISNIKYGSLTWQENKYGVRSFDEELLKTDECSRDGKDYDTTKDVCETRTIDAIEDTPTEIGA